jgi:hypothetical protein
VRWRAAEALTEYNDDRVAQALQEVLRDPYWEVRHAAVVRLAGQKNGAKRALALQALTDPRYWVQKAADDVLQQFRESGDLDAQRALRVLANDRGQPEGVRAAAREALAKIEARWSGVRPGSLIKAEKPAVRDGVLTQAEGPAVRDGVLAQADAEHGEWRMENGRPEAEATEDGEWRMENGRPEGEGSGWKQREPWWRRLRRR